MRSLFRKVAHRLGVTPPTPTTPLEQQNAAEVARHSQRGDQIVFVSSFPRSGNTWLRYLLCDCLLQATGVETSTATRSQAKAVIPGFQSRSIAARDATVTPGRLFLKTHADYTQAMTMTQCQPGPNVKHIFLYRCPEDALVSYYHFHRHRAEEQTLIAEGIDAFCLSQLPAWCTMGQSYLAARAAAPESLFLLSYEQMLIDPAPILQALLTWLGISLEQIDVQRAIANMAFENLQAAETEKQINSGQKRFFRRGQSGGGQVELEPSTLAQIQSETAQILEQANGILVQQQSGG